MKPNQPTLHSHTHCQAAQAHAQTKAWQRVCLSNTRPKQKTAKPLSELTFTTRMTERQLVTFIRVDEKSSSKKP